MDTSFSSINDNEKMNDYNNKLLPNKEINEFNNFSKTTLEGNIKKCDSEILNSKQFKFKFRFWYVILLTLNISIGNFFVGWCFGVFDPIQMNLVVMFDWTESEKDIYLSLISAFLPLGAVLGAFLSGPLSKKIGRRKAHILTDILCLIGTGITIILNVYTIIAGRLICGISIGLYSTLISVYVNEFAPYEISGLCGTIYEFFYCLGIFLSYVAGLNLPSEDEPQNDWWRIMVSIPGILCFIRMLCLLFVFKHDTPKFLFMNKNDVEESKKCLRTIYLSEEDVEEMIQDYTKFKHETKDIKFKDLFSKKYRIRLLLGCILMLGQQIGGVDVILMYSDHIYFPIVGTKKLATTFTLFSGFSMVVAGLISVFIIEKFGRRKLLITVQSLLVINLFVISFFYYMEYVSYVVIYLFILFIFLNGIGIAPISYIYTSDILPEYGVAISVLINYVASYFVTQTFLFFEKSFLRMHGTMAFFGFSSLFVLIIAIFFMKETKNKSANEIDKLF